MYAKGFKGIQNFGRKIKLSFLIYSFIFVLFCLPSSALANVTGVAVTNFQTNANGTYYSDAQTATFTYTVDAADYLLGARYTRVYTCLSWTSCHEVDGSLTPIDATTKASSSILPLTQNAVPDTYGYTAVVEYDAGQAYLAEYSINYSSAFGGLGGWLVQSPVSSSTIATSSDLAVFDDMAYHGFVVFFISLILTIWMCKQFIL